MTDWEMLRIVMRLYSVLILIVLSLSFISSAQALQLQYKVSEVHGLLTFALAISGEPNRPQGLAQVFKKSSYNTKAVGKLIGEWNQLRPAFNRMIEPAEEKFRQGTNEVLIQLIAQSINSTD